MAAGQYQRLRNSLRKLLLSPDDVGELFPYNPLGSDLSVVITPGRIRTCRSLSFAPHRGSAPLASLAEARSCYPDDVGKFFSHTF